MTSRMLRISASRLGAHTSRIRDIDKVRDERCFGARSTRIDSDSRRWLDYISHAMTYETSDEVLERI